MTPTPRADHAGTAGHSSSARMTWAPLLARLFQFDLEHCPHCGGTLKILAAIEDPALIVAILTHLGLPARAPPRSPARALPLFQPACAPPHELMPSGALAVPGIALGWHSPAG